jgi:hypothetical protein
MTLPRNLIEYVHPKGFELRRVNNGGDISWHKGRVFIIIVNEFSWESTFGRMGYRYRDFSMLFFGIAAILWGSVMIVDGLLGVARRMVKGK